MRCVRNSFTLANLFCRYSIKSLNSIESLESFCRFCVFVLDSTESPCDFIFYEYLRFYGLLRFARNDEWKSILYFCVESCIDSVIARN